MKILSVILDIVTVMMRFLEAEGRVLRRAVINAGWGLAWVLAFMAIAALLVLVAAGFFLYGIYQYLALQVSPAAASLIVALPALVLALIFAGIAKWLTAEPK
jgi:hypothetical protein